MKVYSLIDITETKAHKSRTDDKFTISQQSNFMSFFQTLSMRFNPYYEKSPVVQTMTEAERKKIGLGTSYKGEQKVWIWDFTYDTAVAGVDIDLLEKDFDLIPMISGLNETIKINNNVFRTSDKKIKNIVFEAPQGEQ